MNVDAERKAWEYLHENGNGLVGKEIINAINASHELSCMEKMIRRVVSEELKKITIVSVEPDVPSPENDEAETLILDFLESF
jgi:hypothetical protein